MQADYRGLGQRGGGLSSPPEATELEGSGTLEEVGKEAAIAGQQFRENGCSEWNSRRKVHTVTVCLTNIVEMVHFLLI